MGHAEGRIRFGLIALSAIVATTWLWPSVARPLVNQSSFPQAIAVLETVEQIALSDDWRQTTERMIPEGGHAMAIIGLGASQQCADLRASLPNVKITVILPSRLTSPSSTAVDAGTYFDILAPVNAETCRLSAYRLIEWKPDKTGLLEISSGSHSVHVNVSFSGQFKQASKPFFVGLSNAFLIKGHCAEYCPREAELGRKYASLLRAHHATPIQTWIRVPPIQDGRLDLHYGHAKGQSFWQTGGGLSQRYVNVPRMSLYQDSDAYLKALERTIQDEGLSGRAWVYVRDEPTDFDALKQELQAYRTLAPSARTMVTTPYRADLDGLIDVFAPNIAQWDSRDSGYDGTAVWPYASCMGSCGPNRAYKNDTQRIAGLEVDRPDFLIDRAAQRIDAYFSALDRSGAEGGLYYHAVEGHALYRKGIDVHTDPWNFGGNGDGVLIYPGRPGELGLTEHMALPSFRLKLIRQAIERHWRAS